MQIFPVRRRTKYNPEGKFPYTLLLTADGKILKAWDGNPDVKPEAFAAEVQGVIDTEP